MVQYFCSSSSSTLNREDELYELVDELVRRNLMFHKWTVEDKGCYIIQVLNL